MLELAAVLHVASALRMAGDDDVAELLEDDVDVDVDQAEEEE